MVSKAVPLQELKVHLTNSVDLLLVDRSAQTSNGSGPKDPNTDGPELRRGGPRTQGDVPWASSAPCSTATVVTGLFDINRSPRHARSGLPPVTLTAARSLCLSSESQTRKEWDPSVNLDSCKGSDNAVKREA